MRTNHYVSEAFRGYQLEIMDLRWRARLERLWTHVAWAAACLIAAEQLFPDEVEALFEASR